MRSKMENLFTMLYVEKKLYIPSILKTGQCKFLGQRTEVPALSWDKGTTGQVQNVACTVWDSLSKSRTGRGTGRDSTIF